MNLKDYEIKIKDYSINMLSFEKEETKDAILSYEDDLKFELSCKPLDEDAISIAKKRMTTANKKLSAINQRIQKEKFYAHLDTLAIKQEENYIPFDQRPRKVLNDLKDVCEEAILEIALLPTSETTIELLELYRNDVININKALGKSILLETKDETGGYRVEFNQIEYQTLLEVISQAEYTPKIKMISNCLQKTKFIKLSENKIKGIGKATEARTKNAKEKIENAINILRLECRPITHYSIATIGEVSYNTVKKYISDEDMKGLKC